MVRLERLPSSQLVIAAIILAGANFLEACQNNACLPSTTCVNGLVYTETFSAAGALPADAGAEAAPDASALEAAPDASGLDAAADAPALEATPDASGLDAAADASPVEVASDGGNDDAEGTPEDASSE